MNPKNARKRNSKTYRMWNKGWAKERQSLYGRNISRHNLLKSETNDIHILRHHHGKNKMNHRQGKYTIGKDNDTFVRNPRQITSNRLLKQYKHGVKEHHMDDFYEDIHPIFEAVRNQDLSNLDKWIKIWKGAIFMKDSCGRTPIFLACELGFLDIVKFLYSKGSSLNSCAFVGDVDFKPEKFSLSLTSLTMKQI